MCLMNNRSSFNSSALILNYFKMGMLDIYGPQERNTPI